MQRLKQSISSVLPNKPRAGKEDTKQHMGLSRPCSSLVESPRSARLQNVDGLKSPPTWIPIRIERQSPPSLSSRAIPMTPSPTLKFKTLRELAEAAVSSGVSSPRSSRPTKKSLTPKEDRHGHRSATPIWLTPRTPLPQAESRTGSRAGSRAESKSAIPIRQTPRTPLPKAGSRADSRVDLKSAIPIRQTPRTPPRQAGSRAGSRAECRADVKTTFGQSPELEGASQSTPRTIALTQIPTVKTLRELADTVVRADRQLTNMATIALLTPPSSPVAVTQRSLLSVASEVLGSSSSSHREVKTPTQDRQEQTSGSSPTVKTLTTLADAVVRADRQLKDIAILTLPSSPVAVTQRSLLSVASEVLGSSSSPREVKTTTCDRQEQTSGSSGCRETPPGMDDDLHKECTPSSIPAMGPSTEDMDNHSSGVSSPRSSRSTKKSLTPKEDRRKHESVTPVWLIPRTPLLQASCRAGSQAGSSDDNRAGSRADNRTGSRADNRAGSKAGNKADSRADNRAGSQADNRAGNRADNRTGSRADNRAGSKTGNKADSRADNRAGSQADNRAGNRADNRAGSKAGHRAGSQAGSRADNRTGSQADNRADSRSESKTGSRADNRAGSRADSKITSGKSAEPKGARQSTTRAATANVPTPPLTPQSVRTKSRLQTGEVTPRTSRSSTPVEETPRQKDVSPVRQTPRSPLDGRISSQQSNRPASREITCHSSRQERVAESSPPVIDQHRSPAHARPSLLPPLPNTPPSPDETLKTTRNSLTPTEDGQRLKMPSPVRLTPDSRLGRADSSARHTPRPPSECRVSSPARPVSRARSCTPNRAVVTTSQGINIIDTMEPVEVTVTDLKPDQAQTESQWNYYATQRADNKTILTEKKTELQPLISTGQSDKRCRKSLLPVPCLSGTASADRHLSHNTRHDVKKDWLKRKIPVAVHSASTVRERDTEKREDTANTKLKLPPISKRGQKVFNQEKKKTTNRFKKPQKDGHPRRPNGDDPMPMRRVLTMADQRVLVALQVDRDVSVKDTIHLMSAVSTDKETEMMIEELKLLETLASEYKQRLHEEQERELALLIELGGKQLLHKDTIDRKNKVNKHLADIVATELTADNEYSTIESYLILQDQAANLSLKQRHEESTISYLQEQLPTYPPPRARTRPPKIVPKMTKNALRMQKEKGRAVRTAMTEDAMVKRRMGQKLPPIVTHKPTTKATNLSRQRKQERLATRVPRPPKEEKKGGNRPAKKEAVTMAVSTEDLLRRQ